MTHLAWLRSAITMPVGLAGATLLAIIMAVALFAPNLLDPPLQQDLADRYVRFSLDHPMGTDQFGRDMFARVANAARGSILVGISIGAFAGVLGGLIGLMSGYVGGRFDLLVQRAVDAIMALPLIVFTLAIVVAAPDSRVGIITALSIGFAPLTIRLTRSSALTLRITGYAEASRAIGASHTAIIFRHVVPNAAGPWLIVIGTQIGAAILAESSLSFLGFGSTSASPSLGSLIGGDAQTFVHRAPWMILWPGAAITALVLGVNMVSEALSDALVRPVRRKSASA